MTGVHPTEPIPTGAANDRYGAACVIRPPWQAADRPLSVGPAQAGKMLSGRHALVDHERLLVGDQGAAARVRRVHVRDC